ncbi:MAG: 16S rRNA (uracil(1498)-N(3))-methyltransferase [Candidatus Omnitrophica bacterium]|nr:16S rRNA (uracil(1498)-N(3))-methyltransferase [Candidatus Omnitrophota bacterium]
MKSSFTPNLVLEQNTYQIINSEEIHHLKNVLRVKAGEEIRLFNGQGVEAIGIITQIKPAAIAFQIKEFSAIQEETKPRTILACAIPKKSKFELIIEKATELGVAEIVPLLTQRTEFSAYKNGAEHKLERYQTVAINACKQCQRARVPIIHNFMKFEPAIDFLISRSTVIIPSLRGNRKLLKEALSLPAKQNNFSFLIGPEGDFTPGEYDFAFQKGCTPVTLGSTILRVETAALSVLAYWRIAFGDELCPSLKE